MKGCTYRVDELWVTKHALRRPPKVHDALGGVLWVWYALGLDLQHHTDRLAHNLWHASKAVAIDLCVCARAQRRMCQ
jgi:hypothetical protein